METLQINKKDALVAHEKAGPKTKVMLENLLGKAVFLKLITERITCFDDVLIELNIDKLVFEKSCEGLEPDEVAYKMAKLVAKALNEGWIPDWSNDDEYKYFPYFKMGSPSGVGFSYDGYGRWVTYSTVGSRLAFKSRELAEFAGKLFEQEIYKPLLTIQSL